MATPVEVSFVKRCSGTSGPAASVEGFGGLFNDKPWYLRESYVIAEVEKPPSRRVWDFYVRVGGEAVPMVVAAVGGRKYLTACAGDDGATALLRLPECPATWRAVFA